MKLDDEEITHLSKLCRIHLNEKEKQDVKKKLKEVLSYIDTLSELDVEGVAPCNHVLENISTVLREDLEGSTLSREEFLANSPDHIGGMIKVPPIIKFEK